MELWIISQDKKLLRKLERLCMVEDLGKYYIADNGDIYGEYRTKKRDILDLLNGEW